MTDLHLEHIISGEQTVSDVYINITHNWNKKPFKRETSKINRNEKCPCGSEKKYKKCCLKDNGV